MKNKTKTILCTLAVAGVIGTSGILAYLTDNDSATNKFTVGKVDIDLVEDTWDNATDTDGDEVPDFAEEITANQTIEKDPKIQNIGKNDAYVYLEVKVPVAEVKTVADDGTPLNNGDATATELFTFEVNEGWTQLSRTEGTGEVTYVYYYNEVVAPNGETGTLFDEVKFANVIEGQVDDTVIQEIDIKAYAIQSDNLAGDETVAEAYEIYVNQHAND